MMKVRITHPSGMVEIHEWRADKAWLQGANMCWEQHGMSIEILEYRHV